MWLKAGVVGMECQGDKRLQSAPTVLQHLVLQIAKSQQVIDAVIRLLDVAVQAWCSWNATPVDGHVRWVSNQRVAIGLVFADSGCVLPGERFPPRRPAGCPVLPLSCLPKPTESTCR